MLKYPGYDAQLGTQRFPHRTFAMLMVLVSHLSISCLTRYLYKRGFFPKSVDILQVFPENDVCEKNQVKMVKKDDFVMCETSLNR